MPNLVHVVYHSGSNYGYHFILKEFIKKMYFLWKIQKSAKNFLIPIEIEVIQIDKDGKGSIVTTF